MSSSSSAAADSFIGSLISLISKSEIRYEGILVSINPQESTIALHNVRSYGSEGRRKGGPQVPPSGKEYEYILFRGTDIKDLQVKSSPSVHTKPQIHHDPAITQSHNSGNTCTPSSHASSDPVEGEILSYKAVQLDVARQPIPDKFSLYQTGATMSSWASSSAVTNTEAAAFTSPMYSQGFVNASTSQPLGEQQTVHSHPQDHAPTRTGNFSLSSGPLIFPSESEISNYTYLSPSLSSNNSLLPSPSSSVPYNLPAKPTLASSNQELNSMAANNSLLPSSSLSVPYNLPAKPTLASSNQELNSMALISGKAGPSSTPFFPLSSLHYSLSSTSGASNPFAEHPPLLNPEQLISSLPAATSSHHNLYPEPKHMEVLLPSSTDSVAHVMPQASLLHLPTSFQQGQPGVSQFSEEFDFTAMNEKFKKDEVWGTLGKENQGTMLTGAECDPIHCYNVELKDDYTRSPYNAGSRSVYNKDDFFDTISCTSLNRGAWSGRGRFSERMKQDSETFGVFQQRPTLGRGHPDAGNFRGLYSQGRGYGSYGGRGHGVYRPF
ncbi:protein decapping 5-like [Iris pallida]|uniref:Protein decapping 5-like n=1 Tax=Iris pallida TaxID=29817 RepID=A0AAX6DQR6_IRIPA|nr:protein decapping 5-like [Iris pallida]